MAVKLEETFMSFLSQLEDDNSSLTSSLHLERMTLVRLQQQVSQLCQERDRIRQQLEERTKQLKIAKSKSGVIEETPKLEFVEKKKLLGELLNIYGLMGIEVCSSERKNVLLKFTSTSDGVYRCTYKLEIRVSERQIEAESYDLPPFIPLDNILSRKSFTYSDVCSIAKEISDYLYSYTVRDKGVHDIQDLYGPDILSGLQYSFARELISFRLTKHACALDCTLSYFNLLAILPDEITVDCTDLGLRYTDEWLVQFQESSGMSLAKMKLPLAINSILQALDVAAAQRNASAEVGSNSEETEDSD